MTEPNRKPGRILTGAAAFAIGVFICGSVGSYMPSDPSWNAATDAEVQNLFGSAGAIFADLSRQMLGWSAWAAGLAGAVGQLCMGTPQPAGTEDGGVVMSFILLSMHMHG